MTSAITEYEYPVRFVDEQQRGPFRRWWHEHTFTAVANGETQMTDVVEFRSPLGPLGSIADRMSPGVAAMGQATRRARHRRKRPATASWPAAVRRAMWSSM